MCTSSNPLHHLLLLLLKHAFGSSDEGILLRTQSEGKLFNPARLRAKSKVRKRMLRDLLLADDAALVAHSERELQTLLDRFLSACAAFSLIINLKKTKVMHQGAETALTLTINEYTL